MTITNFTPWPSLLGGVLIGLATTLVLLANGKIAGISGVAARLPPPVPGDRLWQGPMECLGKGLWQEPLEFPGKGLWQEPLKFLRKSLWQEPLDCAGKGLWNALGRASGRSSYTSIRFGFSEPIRSQKFLT